MSYLPQGQTILEAGASASEDEKIQFIQQLLQALAYLHRHAILHHNIKPRNVLVVAGRVKLLDFGLSQRREEQAAAYAGTVLYLAPAPEPFNGGLYSEAADLYAVGMLAYPLLTGEHPFAPFDFQFLDRVQATNPDLTLLANPLGRVLKQMLAFNPADRPATAVAAREMFFSLSNRLLPF